MKLMKITPEGTFSIVETTRKKFLNTCHREIGCTMIEMPACMGLPDYYRLIVDESGLVKEDPKVNLLPWYWYSKCHPEAPIVGTVLIGRIERVGKYRELDIVGLTDRDIEYLKEWETSAAAAYAEAVLNRGFPYDPST